MGYRLLFTFLVLGLLTTGSESITGLLQTAGDIATAGLDTAKAVADKIPDLIPDPSTIFSLGKDAIAGLPFKVLIEAINQLCSVALAGNGVISKYTPDINEMTLVLITPSDNVTVPLVEPERLWDNPLFDHKVNTALLVTGWGTDISDDAQETTTINTIYNAYKARGNHNFVVLDMAQFIDTLYSWSAFNTEEIGKHFGNALAKLTDVYPSEKIHVIGHSLGGQIAGSAGRYYYAKKNKLLPRITGLDPANPCFNEGESLNGLYRGDAEFVDVIHTNNGALGVQYPIGDVDFYPNGVSVLQPGCLLITCAHARSVHLYAETVENENSLMAIRCNSILSLDAGTCPGEPIPMGYATPKNARGNYFLKTEASSPYGNNYKID